jgi:hypothetical protein
MQRGLTLLFVPALFLFGCGGDDDTSDAASGGDDEDQTLAEQFGDDPTFDECIDGLRQILESIEVPDGVDPSDGIDADEQELVDDELEGVFEAEGLDPSGEDDPCADHVGPEADAATAEIFEDLDPDVVSMLGGG